MKNDDIAATLAATYIQETRGLQSLPVDICFGCADIKYNDGKFKIVECGDGIYMSLRATDVVMNNKQYNLVAPFWGLLWHQLAQFGIPVWHVEAISSKEAFAVSEYKKLGILYQPSLSALENSLEFQAAESQVKASPKRITDSAGIVVFAAASESTRDGITYQEFKKKHPLFIYVNRTARNYLKRKDNTYKLFQSAGLTDYIPQFKLFPRAFSPEAVEQITQAFPEEKLIVIKPTFSSLSMGVNVVSSLGLNSFLKRILKHPEKISPQASRGLAFWRTTKQPLFIASEYVPSKTIYKDGKPYDPTMRVMFILYHNNRQIVANVLGGFWKIPVKPLNDFHATETEKHVTIAHAGDYFSGILLEAEESKRMKQVLAPVLARAYEQMLLEQI